MRVANDMSPGGPLVVQLAGGGEADVGGVWARVAGWGSGARLRERHSDRERLRQAAAVFDCTREGVLVTDHRGLIVHVNRAFIEITGYRRDEVIGQQPSLFKSGHHPPGFYQAMFATLEA
ncbi:PAS domain S-box protein, partial [Psychrobacter sp. TB20-MNA-CIBAN-0197]|uniref:PAS domain S-box protein n=1 Tax=Psychrobacter sp. TB20-MNA-CIBAN-0197 TaxID=3140453 RepID=UPI003325EA73